MDAVAVAARPPRAVAWLSRGGFRTPQGLTLMAGLHFAPLALFLRPAAVAGGWAAAPAWRALLAALLAARGAAALVELWLLRQLLGARRRGRARRRRRPGCVARGGRGASSAEARRSGPWTMLSRARGFDARCGKTAAAACRCA
jgi:hypothetical protein